ncbi:MAG: (2Fe-2S)-binding protein [Pseudomonadota bacterium]
MMKTIYIDGQSCPVEEGELLAAVLLRQPEPLFRKHPVDGSPRAAFCMMGVCFECLVEVNGIGNQQACMIRVEDGMKINRSLS